MFVAPALWVFAQSLSHSCQLLDWSFQRVIVGGRPDWSWIAQWLQTLTVLRATWQEHLSLHGIVNINTSRQTAVDKQRNRLMSYLWIIAYHRQQQQQQQPCGLLVATAVFTLPYLSLYTASSTAPAQLTRSTPAQLALSRKLERQRNTARDSTAAEQGSQNVELRRRGTGNWRTDRRMCLGQRESELFIAGVSETEEGGRRGCHTHAAPWNNSINVSVNDQSDRETYVERIEGDVHLVSDSRNLATSSALIAARSRNWNQTSRVGGDI